MLANKALLANITICQWTGRKHDKRANDTVETSFSTAHRVGNYTKKLLPGSKELDEVARQAGAMRQWYYDNTLPWCTDGSRILSSSHYLAFTQEFNQRKAAFDTAVEDFIAAYPALKARAQQSLGSLFVDADYPTQAYLRQAFDCSVAFMPIPDVQDFRVQVLDSEKDAFLARMRDVEAGAVRDCYGRLHDVVTRAVQKLSQPGAIFRDSLIENITEVCALLPKLNVMDDPQLDTMRKQVETLVAGISPDSIRASEASRVQAADKLADISSKMSAFMGA